RSEIHRSFLALQMRHLPAQEAAVKIETDGIHIAVLLGSQNIAGAANLHILQGDMHSASEGGKFLQDFQALLGRLPQGLVPGEKEISESLAVRPSYSSLQ